MEEQGQTQVKDVFTVGRYLKSLVRNISIDDDTLTGILIRRGLDKDTPLEAVTEEKTKNLELSQADVYAWVALSPTTSKQVKDADGDWSHEEGGETMSALVLNRFLRMANDIYAKYEEPKVGDNSWGMSGSGFHDVRNYGGLRDK